MSSNGQGSRRFVITGANRGLGLEMCRQLVGAGHEVFALARRPSESPRLTTLLEESGGRLLQHACDVDNAYSVQDAAAAVDAAWESVDVVINNAGVSGKKEDSFLALDVEDIRSVFETNTLGPVRVIQAFLPAVKRAAEAGRQPAPGILHVTSLMGSIADNAGGGRYPYRISKAALNMLHKNLSIELDGSGVWSVAMHPGWVQTDMGGGSAPLKIEDAVSSMLATLHGLTTADNGRFVDRDGSELPW